MDSRWRPHTADDFRTPQYSPQPPLSTSTVTILIGIITLYLAHTALVYFDYPILSPVELLWNALVFVTPQRLVLNRTKRAELRANDMLAQTHAAKSEALRRMFGLGGAALTQKFVGGEGIMRRMSGFAGSGNEESTSDVPPGLGNWDNSCYQNSVLQGMSSLESLKKYLGAPRMEDLEAESTTGSLQQTVAKLSGAENNGKQLWTPAKLKSMSSWQQQDAQEYFSKIMDELDKEAAKGTAAVKAEAGLEGAVKGAEVAYEEPKEDARARNPLEGLLAQRVACTRCGFSEGLSMIPFNCLTVPLGSSDSYDLEDCLDEYTKLEDITDVDCPKCTLLRAEGQLRQMIPAEPASSQSQPRAAPSSLSLPPELRVLAAKRLQAIQTALDVDDFSDTTMNETCQIPKKARVSSTKTRQAVIGRAPRSLVVHINRSVFDEMTGVQRKNYATVRYPKVLDLGMWMLGGAVSGSATELMLHNASSEQCSFRLKAVIQHYGRHENGHYIAYRQHPARRRETDEEEDKKEEGIEKLSEQWWRLSDEDVSMVSEDVALGQGGAFMLFYERVGEDEVPARQQAEVDVVAAEPLADTKVETPQPATTTGNVYEASNTATFPTPDADEEPAVASAASSSPPPVFVTTESPSIDEPSTPSTTEDRLDPPEPSEPVSHATTTPVPRLPSPNTMRTARGRQASKDGNGFGGNVFRAMATT